jgi:hypothetical protein
MPWPGTYVRSRLPPGAADGLFCHVLFEHEGCKCLTLDMSVISGVCGGAGFGSQESSQGLRPSGTSAFCWVCAGMLNERGLGLAVIFLHEMLL